MIVFIKGFKDNANKKSKVKSQNPKVAAGLGFYF